MKDLLATIWVGQEFWMALKVLGVIWILAVNSSVTSLRERVDKLEKDNRR